jgi:hypothetical protein
VARLTAYQAHNIGIETRPAATLQGSGDLRQEQDSEAQKVKTAEARIATLKNFTGRVFSLSPIRVF